MKRKHQVLLKKAYYLIQADCDHDVSNEPAGTACACAELLLRSKGQKVTQ